MPIIATLRTNLLACVLGLAAAVFLIISVVQSVEINGFLWIDGLKDKLEDCARDWNELRAISTAKDEQKAETGRRVEQAEKNEREAKPIVDRIRAAPIPPNCATPGLDLLRNEI